MDLVMRRLCGWRAGGRERGREGWEGSLVWWKSVLGLMEGKGRLFLSLKLRLGIISCQWRWI